MCFCTMFSSFGSRLQINWKQSDSSQSSTAYTGLGMHLDSSLSFFLSLKSAWMFLARKSKMTPMWRECNHFCMAHWRRQPLTPSFQQWQWNPSQGMSAWPAVIASQSWCHRSASFPQWTSQLLHALPSYYLFYDHNYYIMKTWNFTKM